MANVNRQKLILGLVRWSIGQNPGSVQTPLMGIINAIMTNGLQEGRMLVQVNEAGGTVQFQPFDGYDGPGLIALVEEALEWLNQQPNPNKPRVNSRVLKRLKISFSKTSFQQNAFVNP